MEQLLERITALENRVDELEQEKTNLKQENQQLREENKRLRAKLRWYEGPHTPPSKTSPTESRRPSSDADEDDEQPRTDGGTPGRKPGHDPEWRAAPDPDRKSTLPVTAVRVWRRVRRVGGRQPRLVASSRSTATRSYIVQPPSLRVLLFCGAEIVKRTHAPSKRGQFGVNVIARRSFQIRSPPPLPEDRRPLRTTAWPRTLRCICVARDRARCAPVAVNTNRSADGFSTLTLFTSTRRESNATANRRGCGRSPRTSTRCTRSERVAEAMFRQYRTSRGTVVCDGWTAYPAFTSNLQRCWAHILREAEDVNDKIYGGPPASRKCTSVSSRGWRPTRAPVSEHRCTDQARTDSNRSLGAQLPTTQWQHCSGRSREDRPLAHLHR